MVRRQSLQVRIPRRPTAALVATAALVLLGERLLTLAVEQTLQNDPPAWFPQFGSLGETVVRYALVFDVLTYVVIPILLVWFGYALGRSRAERPADR